MSKASEWASGVQKAKTARPECVVRVLGYSRIGAWTDESGGVAICAGALPIYLKPDDAVTIARWILETFGGGPHEG